MQFIETRGNDPKKPAKVSFTQALLNPMASFGGLYSPESLPQLSSDFFTEHLLSDYTTLATAVLELFKTDLKQEDMQQALSLYRDFDDPDNPAPVTQVEEDLFVCELYHGPTRAFKDMALQPFGVLLSRLAESREEQYLILAATSGDTGPAALETFKNRPGVRVACLYPDGGTSDVQRLQMVTEDAQNLKVIGIHGSFDDAQTALKTLLSSESFNQRLKQLGISLSAANSVNFGRIIFQIIYHIHAYLELCRKKAIQVGEKVYLNVPCGNFGNALGGYFAWKMGLPVEKIIAASNRNNVLSDFINSGLYDLSDRELFATTSPAMDILISSNIERILFDLFGAQRTRELMEQLKQHKCYQLNDDELSQLQQFFTADYCDDEQGKAIIHDTFDHGYLIDPHTATCFKAHQTCRDKPLKSIIYSTAEWTKFSPVIDEALNQHSGRSDQQALTAIAEKADIPIPSMISALFEKPITQDSVINKQDIETEILNFLNR